MRSLAILCALVLTTTLAQALPLDVSDIYVGAAVGNKGRIGFDQGKREKIKACIKQYCEEHVPSAVKVHALPIRKEDILDGPKDYTGRRGADAYENSRPRWSLLLQDGQGKYIRNDRHATVLSPVGDAEIPLYHVINNESQPVHYHPTQEALNNGIGELPHRPWGHSSPYDHVLRTSSSHPVNAGPRLFGAPLRPSSSHLSAGENRRGGSAS